MSDLYVDEVHTLGGERTVAVEDIAGVVNDFTNVSRAAQGYDQTRDNVVLSLAPTESSYPDGNYQNNVSTIGAFDLDQATQLKYSTILGTFNLEGFDDVQRVEAFGNYTLANMQKGERTTAVGTIAGQFFGAYEETVKSKHNFWGRYQPELPGEPGWDVGGLETLYPGIGQMIADYTGYTSPTADREDTGRSVFLGRNASNLTVNGSDLVSIGYRANSTLYDASGTTTVGSNAMKNAVFHDDSTVAGYEAARDWVVGSRNVVTGRGAAYQVTSGNYNLVQGTYAGADFTSMTASVLLGYRAGNGLETSPGALDYTFVVANDSATAKAPLLLGDFTDGTLAVNGVEADLGTDPFRVRSQAGSRIFDVTASGTRVGRTSNSTGATGAGHALGLDGNHLSFVTGTGTNNHLQFRNNAGVSPSLVGSITSSGNATAYNTASDRSLKDDAGILDGDKASEILNLIAIHEFKWKLDGKEDKGVFAQELYEVYPNAVYVGGTDEAGEYIPWAVDYSKLVPVLVSAFQSVDARLKALESKE